MKQQILTIEGDTPGANWQVPVLRFKGRDKTSPKVYLQAALHADELPGTAVLHFLCALLRQAEANGRILGDITVVPQANPIGSAQNPNRQLQGRFDVTNGINFNREFALLELAERDSLLENLTAMSATEQLKNNLLYMALGADVVLDLHCDFESLLYAYICEEFWPDAKDFAESMKLHSVFLADGHSSAFEEAVAYAFRRGDPDSTVRRFVTTLELRGQSDVDSQVAETDAAGLYRFLVRRDVIEDDIAMDSSWHGNVVPLDHIEVVRTPVAGVILFNCNLGDEAQAGDELAKVITRPGVEDGFVSITAPQAGTIVTRTFKRSAVRGEQLFKMICAGPALTARQPGTLES